MNLTPEYVAGFFDGEGTILVSSSEAGGSLVVAISSTYLPILRYLHSVYGGYLRKAKSASNRKDCWKRAISSSDAVRFIEDIRPFLIEKEPQAWLGLEYMSQRTLYKGGQADQFLKRKGLCGKALN